MVWQPPRSAADTDAGYELSLHLATYTELTACQSELQEARRRLRKEEERGQVSLHAILHQSYLPCTRPLIQPN